MYIGVDLGTTACKSVAYDAAGAVLAEYESEYGLITENGGVFQDANEWWRQVTLGIRSLVAKCGDSNVDGISASTQGISFVPVNERGTPLSLSVNWLDVRAKEECAALVSHFGAHHIHRVTGRIALPSYTLPMLMLFAKTYPEVISHAAHICLPLDFINLRLTGRHITDYSIAGGTMAFDLRRREYDHELLDFAGVDAAKLPKVGCMGDLVGTVSSKVAAELGITGEMKVYLGGQDQKLAALGAGIEEGTMTVSIGTATAVTRLLDDLPEDEKLSLFAFDRDHFSAEGVVSTSGSALKWVSNAFFGGARYRDLDRLAEEAGGSAGVRIVPDFTTGAAITGLTLGTTPGNVVYALYEGVCAEIADHVREMGGAKLLKVFGGGSKSDIWCRILADAAKIPVAVCDTPQTACRGAAILASGRRIAPCGVKKTFTPGKS